MGVRPLAPTGLHLAPASFKQLSLWSLLALLLDSFRPSTTRTYEAIHNMHFFSFYIWIHGLLRNSYNTWVSVQTMCLKSLIGAIMDSSPFTIEVEKMPKFC